MSDAVESTLDGDVPCDDCGTGENLVWFTDDVVWNYVCRPVGYSSDPILCLPCFVKRAELAGLRPTGWHVLPQWPWRYAGIES